MNDEEAPAADPASRLQRLYRALRSDLMLVGVVFLAVLVLAASLLVELHGSTSILSGGQTRTIVFRTDDVEGLARGSAILCQGLRVGRILSIEQDSTVSAQELHFRAVGELVAPGSNWRYAEKAKIRPAVVSSALAPASIALVYLSGGRSPADSEKEPFSLEADKEQGFADLAPKVRALLNRAETAVDDTQEKVGKLLEREDDSPPLMTRVKGVADALQGTAKKLDDLTGKLGSLSEDLQKQVRPSDPNSLLSRIENLVESSQELTRSVRPLTESMPRRLDQFQATLNGVVGDTPAERQKFHLRLGDALALFPRVGDTPVGRVFIKRPTVGDPPVTVPATKATAQGTAGKTSSRTSHRRADATRR